MDLRNMGKKTASYPAGDVSRIIHDMSHALLSGNVAPVGTPDGSTDNVAEVVDAFNKFISSGEDPYRFPGFVRMRFSPETITEAEPVIRSMMRRGRGIAYVEAGHVSCDELRSAVSKSPFSPRRVVAAPMCSTCIHRDVDTRPGKVGCNKVKTALTNNMSVTDGDLEHLAKVVRSAGVSRGVVVALLSRVDSRGGSNEDKLVSLVKAYRYAQRRADITSRPDMSFQEDYSAELTDTLSGPEESEIDGALEVYDGEDPISVKDTPELELTNSKPKYNFAFSNDGVDSLDAEIQLISESKPRTEPESIEM